MVRAIVGILVLFVIASVGVVGLESALETAGDDVTIVNETWVPDPGSVTTLNDSNIDGAFYDNETTVFNATGEEVDRGSDYEWFVRNGTVKAVVGGALDGESEATITYGYQETTAEQRRLAGLFGRLPQAIGLIAPVFVLVLLLRILRGG